MHHFIYHKNILLYILNINLSQHDKSHSSKYNWFLNCIHFQNLKGNNFYYILNIKKKNHLNSFLCHILDNLEFHNNGDIYYTAILVALICQILLYISCNIYLLLIQHFQFWLNHIIIQSQLDSNKNIKFYF